MYVSIIKVTYLKRKKINERWKKHLLTTTRHDMIIIYHSRIGANIFDRKRFPSLLAKIYKNRPLVPTSAGMGPSRSASLYTPVNVSV